MNPALADLKDIHLPPALPWWDLAVGWWVLLALLILCLLLLLYKMPEMKARRMAKRRRKLLQHAILEEFQTIKSSFQHDNNAPVFVSAISSYLRRVALLLPEKDAVAGLVGRDWLVFLDGVWVEDQPEPSFLSPEIADLLTHAAYQAQFDAKMEQSTMKLLNISERWVHEVRKHHV